MGPSHLPPRPPPSRPLPPPPLPLLLLLLGSFLPCPASGAASILNICVIGDPAGWDYCDPSRPSSTFTGFDIELWRDAAARAGWAEEDSTPSTTSPTPTSPSSTSPSSTPPSSTPPSSTSPSSTVSYRFVCTDQAKGGDLLAEQLAAPGTLGQCAAGAGAFALTSARLEAGLQLSLPYYRTGLAVLVKTNKQDVNIWAFWTPLNPILWVAFLLTITCIPPLTWVVEQVASHGAVFFNRDSMDRAHSATFAAFMAMFNASFYRTNTLPAQLPNFFLVFLIVIVMATYVAQLASVLTAPDAASPFDSISDLRAMNVAAHSSYVDRLARFYGLQASDMPWNGSGTFSNVKDLLSSGELDAYIMDYPELGHHVMTHNPDCSVTLLPHTYTDIRYGFLFHRDLPAPLLDAFNAALFASLESNLPEELSNRFLTFLGSMQKCAATDTQVRFIQIAGLWIMLAGSLVLTLCWSLLEYLRHRSEAAAEAAAEAEAAGQPARGVLARSASSLVMRAFSFMKRDSTYEDSADPYARN